VTTLRKLTPLERHARLLIGLGAGAVLFAALSFSPLRVNARLILSWDAAMLIYLAQAARIVMTANLEDMKARARQIDEGELTIFFISVIAAAISLTAIILELSNARPSDVEGEVLRITLTIVTLIGAWAFIHTAFSFHYAHLYYADDAPKFEPGLSFPGKAEPLYSDFLYFAFIIGTSGQTADVSLTTTRMRRIGTLHCILAFLFNTTLVALMINISASFLGK
jgi:uncharacterized membrane protein